jgi:TonB family protein
MKPRRLSLALQFGAAAAFLFAVAANAQAQETASSATPETGVVLTRLFPPVYPPLAKQARIAGDVKIFVEIQRDGSVVSVKLFSGHPILWRAALESAQKSTFECHGCGEMVTSFPMTYTFGFQDGGGCRWTERVRASRCL